MRIWLDAQLSPAIATWMVQSFDLEDVLAVQADLVLRVTMDREIFTQARAAGAVVMTKDRDFVALLDQLGPPPSVIWLTCGNTSNASLRRILSSALPRALELVRSGEPLVEISDRG